MKKPQQIPADAGENPFFRGCRPTLMDRKHPSYRAGQRYGKKISSGSVIDPAKLIHSAAVERGKGAPTLQQKIDTQRLFKAGAYAMFKKETGVDLEK